MEKENEQISEAKTAVRKHRTFGETVSHNFWLKVLALLFSILLWSYVINETNPVRSKIFSDLPITVNGLSELQGQRLVPLEDLSVKLPRMSVTLNIPHKELGNVNASSIQIYIDLSRVTATGRQTVPVNVVCNNADVSVAHYSPQNVEIVIDELASAIIPVRLNTSGSLPENLYQNEAQVQPKTISISGPQEYVSRITQAQVNVDLARMTDGYSASMPYIFVNQDGQAINAANITADTEAVLVDMNILSKKTVPIEYASKLLGKDALAEGYELRSATLSRNTVTIVGTAQTLSEISQLVIAPVDLTGLDDSTGTLEAELSVPDGVTVLGDTHVQLRLDIAEKTELRSYQIRVLYQNAMLGYTSKTETVTVVLRGKYFTLAGVSERDIFVIADLAGLQAGTHQVKLEAKINAHVPNVTVELAPSEVTVELKNPNS